MIDGVSPLSPAERMRRYCTRRRNGHACITVELREDEIAALISCGLLEVDQRDSRVAIAAALHAYLDRNPIPWRMHGDAQRHKGDVSRQYGDVLHA
jgi:hypothetical protein